MYAIRLKWKDLLYLKSGYLTPKEEESILLYENNIIRAKYFFGNDLEKVTRAYDKIVASNDWRVARGSVINMYDTIEVVEVDNGKVIDVVLSKTY